MSCWEPTIDKYYNQWFLLDFGPFRGILGLLTKLLRPVASERQVQLCFFMSSNVPQFVSYSLGCWNCAVILNICRGISCRLTIFLSKIGKKHGFFNRKSQSLSVVRLYFFQYVSYLSKIWRINFKVLATMFDWLLCHIPLLKSCDYF